MTNDLPGNGLEELHEMSMFMKCLKASVVLLVVIRLGAAQSAHAADRKKAAKVTYEEHVLPILRDKCIGCHSPDKARSGLVVSTYPGIMAGGSSGEVIKPGDPDNSRL